MVSRVASLGIHSFRGPPFLSRDTVTSRAACKDLRVDVKFPEDILEPSFGMAWELIICLVSRSVGSVATLHRKRSCLVVMRSFAVGRLFSQLFKMLLLEMW